MGKILLDGFFNMKKLLSLALLLVLCGCNGSPTGSNPIVTEILSISLPQPPYAPGTYIDGSGAVYDITTSASPTTFILNNVSGGCTVQVGKHDTVEFRINLTSPNAPCTFNYTLGSVNGTAITDATFNSYTSSQITF
jgi:hypothetical protein